MKRPTAAAVLAAALLVLPAAPRAQVPILPDPETTPGALDPAVSQANIHSTICYYSKGQPSWSKAHHPPLEYTEAIKRQQHAAIRVRLPLSAFEEDHLVPLALGGHPTDARNLWLQPWAGEWSAEKKDRLETRLHRLVCRDQVPLAEAQRDIAHNWIMAWGKYCANDRDCPPYNDNE